MIWNKGYEQPKHFTNNEIDQLEVVLREYVKSAYADVIKESRESQDKIIQGWIHFYALEKFTLDESLNIIDDYTRPDPQTEDLDNTEMSEESEDFELRSPMGH